MICDTHLHFYDARYPTSPDAVVHADDASPDDYRPVQDALDIERIVVVQPSAYGLDNSCQLAAMATYRSAGNGLGVVERDQTGNPQRAAHGVAERDHAGILHRTDRVVAEEDHAGIPRRDDDGTVRGVMVVDAHVTDDEVRRLTELGVRGARFHMLPGGAVPWDHLEPVAERIAPFGWHIQLQLNGRELAARRDQLASLPTEVVVDHVGRFMPPVDLDDPNFKALVDLVEAGRAWVKLSAPYESSTEPIMNDNSDETSRCSHDHRSADERSDDHRSADERSAGNRAESSRTDTDRSATNSTESDGAVGTRAAGNHCDVLPMIDHLVDRVPDRLLWATNWPHPGQDVAPTAATLRAQRERWLPTPQLRQQILVTNPDLLYFT